MTTSDTEAAMRKVPVPRDMKAYDSNWTIRMGLQDAPSMNKKPGAGMLFIADDGTERKYSFTEVHDEALRRGRWLLSNGIKKGDHVAFIVPDPEDFVLTFLGATCVGIVPVPLYPPLGFGKLDAYVRDTAKTLTTAKVTALLTQKKVQPILWSLIDTVPTLSQILLTEKMVGPLPANAPEPEVVYPDDVCFLQFTSGSTSAPKGVVVTHKSLGANAYAIMHHGLETEPDDLACSWLPLYHDMGLIGFVISPLRVGLETLFMPTMSFIKRPSLWMEKVSKHRGTITFAPNFAFGLAVKRTSAEKVAAMDLSCLRLIGAGAEPNNPATLQSFLDHFAPAGMKPEAMVPVYGMAEATLAMTFSRLDEPFQTDRICGDTYAAEGRAVPLAGEGTELEFVSCGYVFPDHGIHIIDDAGNHLPDRHTGEIVFSGPSVAAGYLDNPEATAAVFRPDGIRTGDLGYTADGQLFVTGRKKDLIILNGRNYDPQSIEWAVAEVEGIRMGNVIAFSRPGQNTEELVIVAETKEKSDLEELTAKVRAVVRAELNLSPADVVLTGPGMLPKTTSGKLQRAKARAQYLDGTLGHEGDRTLGERGTKMTVAKHVAKSAVSRVRHSVKKGATGVFKRLGSLAGRS